MTEPLPSPLRSRTAAVAAVAATYFYFLIFAEFALIELARPFVASGDVRPMLAVLGLTGIAGSFAGAAWFRPARARRLLAWLFRTAALGAFLTAFTSDRASFLVACAVAGFSLGGLTVVLSASLLAATGLTGLGFCVGLGTGVAYGVCNIPAVFTAAPLWQAVAAGAVVLVASFAPSRLRPVGEAPPPGPDHRGRAGIAWIGIFVALVALDSAAFYVIQHAPALRAATWGARASLWGNATVHLLAAVAAGWAFARGWRGRLVVLALLLLIAACGVLSRGVPGPLSGFLYTAGVSLYSVVLVAYPALSARPWIAARIFALAGWFGSAVGIGLVLNLARIPAGYVAATALLFSAALLTRHRALRSGLALLALFAFAPKAVRAGAEDEAVLRGREVYIAEGCINCHSQYVRPQVASDIERWGPASLLDRHPADQPPLYGNRRQGPDLANVGLRRSPAWNRLHLISPRSVSPGSRMPAYAYLFVQGENRGPDLVAYLASLGAERMGERQTFIAHWRPKTSPTAPGEDTGLLFASLCAPCHGPVGHADGGLVSLFQPSPPNWNNGPRFQAPPGEDELTFLARTIKFGLPGSPMAGHEYLPDDDIVRLARLVQTYQHADSRGSVP